MRVWLVAVVAALLLPSALAQNVSEFDPSQDHAWRPGTGDTLSWVVAGCPEIRQDVVAGMQMIEERLAKARLLPRFERIEGLEPDASALLDFDSDNAGALLVQDIVARSGADIVIGCVPAGDFERIERRHGHEGLLGITFTAYDYHPRTDRYFVKAAVIVLPEGQRVHVEQCGDPQPVGHEWRRVSVMHEALHAAGLGTSHPRDGGIFEETSEARNRSCSAWWIPTTSDLGGATKDRLKAIWGSRDGPGLFGGIAQSMQTHTGIWIGVPLVAAAGAVALVVFLAMRRRSQDRRKLPSSGIHRMDGTIGLRPSLTKGVQMFRAPPEIVPGQEGPVVFAEEDPGDVKAYFEEEKPRLDTPEWGYANRGRLRE